ncbi:MAG: TolB family protein [Thermodesulfobacteriota bacterium]
MVTERVMAGVVGFLWIAGGCAFFGERNWDSQEQPEAVAPPAIRQLVNRVFGPQKEPDSSGIDITYPYHEAVFPPEIAPPTFTWKDHTGMSRRWLVAVSFSEGRKPFYSVVDDPSWTPERSAWEKLKAGSTRGVARFSVVGLADYPEGKVTAKKTVHFQTSTDRVDAAVFYRQVPLPFLATPEGFAKTKWRLGDIAAEEPPTVVMSGLPFCASCHLFSRDGTRFSMEMNYRNDGGAQVIKRVGREMVLTAEDFMTWSDFPKPGILPATRGLFGRMSPSGDYMAASVHEISYAALIDDIAFSQLFFPTYGVLAVYNVKEKKIRLLPGADDYSAVQADPNWSPDERHILFARAPVRNDVHTDIGNVAPHRVDGDIHEMNRRYSIQFDLYRIPFNQGKGGKAVPVEGASGNGMSNYFARYSPDGRWIVFTRSRSGIMLQPDSELYIIPAEGGQARKMRCNRETFNSWHSWSPNGRWLLFSSKVNTPYTEIFLTHVDENGMDTPPVLLSRFSDPQYAANVPEFAPIAANAIRSIRLGDP